MHDIRFEHPADAPAIHRVVSSAFDTAFEADLVDALRRQARPIVSLVALADGEIVGHILFSPVTLSTHPELTLMGLAPMAVVPGRQRQGIGSALAREGIDACRRLDIGGLVVIGHPEYYPRFGFAPATALGWRSEYDVPDEAFMALGLKPGALGGKPGTIRYHAAFAGP